MSEHPEIMAQLASHQKQIAELAVQNARLAKHVEGLHDAVTSCLREVRGFGNEVLKHLDTLSGRTTGTVESDMSNLNHEEVQAVKKSTSAALGGRNTSAKVPV